MNHWTEKVIESKCRVADLVNTWRVIEIPPVDGPEGECDAIVVVRKSQECLNLRPAGPDGKQDNLGRSGLAPSQH